MKQILNPVDNYSDIKPLLYLSKILELAPYSTPRAIQSTEFAYRLPVLFTHL